MRRRATACDGVRQLRLLRLLTRREISPHYQILSTEGAQGPPEASGMQDDDGGGPWPPLPPGGSGNHDPKLLDSLDGLRRA